MTDEESQVMISAGSLPGELSSSAVGEEVGLSDAHLLLLRWACVDRCLCRLGCHGGRELDRRRHLDVFVVVDIIVGAWVTA